MLDSVTKKKIDDLRNILVGKIPSPQSQVEQITTGLIYKFMYDMDNEAIEMGGVPSFFVEEFEKYSWKHLFNSKLGGVEKVKLYSDAIENFYNNPHAPLIFREIFKNSFLPFKDPSTLNMFLKEINEFHYSNSEKLGDAYEYLLSFMGSQGDAGQFRTPRHIIDFIIEIINPQKNESILDPACGTSGFLISSYKHILNQNTQTRIGDKLNASERKQIGENLVGYDIDPAMSRISLVNMYLNRFTSPQIHEYDTLSSEDKWHEYFDVILANPPFFSPTGGIKPHSRFGVKSTRAEVLFVDYIMEHLTPNGRAGIIVPEGIIFQKGTAYKTLRKKIIENYLIGVISLPSGVFQPYSGVKTSILILDRAVNQKSKSIFIAKINSDGFSLGSTRLPIKENELKELRNQLKKNFFSQTKLINVIDKQTIINNEICDLNASTYLKTKISIQSNFDSLPLNDLVDIEYGTRIVKKNSQGDLYPVFGGGGETFRTNVFNRNDCLIISRFAMSSNCVRFIKNRFFLNDSGLSLKIKSNRIIDEFLNAVLLNIQDKIFTLGRGVGQKNLDIDQFKKLTIPLPSLELQRQIIKKINVYQKIIDGCKLVIDNYKPSIHIDKLWEFTNLGDIFENITQTIKPDDIDVRSTKYIGLEHIQKETGLLISNFDSTFSEIKSNKNIFKKGDILYAKLRPNLNKVLLVDFDGICSTDILVLRPKDFISTGFYHSIFLSNWFNKEVLRGISGAQLPRTKFSFISEIKVPYPNKNIQDSIYEKITQEKYLVECSRKLMELQAKKIQEEINKILEE